MSATHLPEPQLHGRSFSRAPSMPEESASDKKALTNETEACGGREHLRLQPWLGLRALLNNVVLEVRVQASPEPKHMIVMLWLSVAACTILHPRYSTSRLKRRRLAFGLRWCCGKNSRAQCSDIFQHSIQRAREYT